MLLTRDWAELTKGKRVCQGLLWGHKLDRLERKRVLEVVESLSWDSTGLLREKRERRQKRHRGMTVHGLDLPIT